MRFVLANSALDVAGDSNVEHLPLAAQDVNIVGFFHAAIIRSGVPDCLGYISQRNLWISHLNAGYLKDVSCRTCGPKERRRGTLRCLRRGEEVVRSYTMLAASSLRRPKYVRDGSIAS